MKLKFSRDPIKISEVVRDLFRKVAKQNSLIVERQMFQVAIERLAREVAAVEKTDYFQSTEKIEQILNKNNILDNLGNFVELNKSGKIWAIGSIHSNLKSFSSIKKYILKNFDLMTN